MSSEGQKRSGAKCIPTTAARSAWDREYDALQRRHDQGEISDEEWVTEDERLFDRYPQ